MPRARLAAKLLKTSPFGPSSRKSTVMIRAPWGGAVPTACQYSLLARLMIVPDPSAWRSAASASLIRLSQ
jgi:hypothetical protein